ncbi:MAG: NACHT domain-containing protein, partial [Blastocatellia bacterium]
MATKYFQWQRYWRPRGSSLLYGESGFLFSPGGYNPDSLPFERIANSPCLVLLGEPGMGKSHAIKAEREGIDEKAKLLGDDVLWLDLRAYGSEDRLVNDLFKSPIFQTWIGGTHKLHIFLDSFDECQIAIKPLASLLADELEKHQPQAERLILRIACRTADWPDLLETALYKMFGNGSVKVYELAPLTREDVRTATIAEGFDSDLFLEEVDRREAGPLAAKPVTLRLLLNIYRNGGSLPTSQISYPAKSIWYFEPIPLRTMLSIRRRA